MSKVVIYSHNNPPKSKGEIFTLPSETDQLANEDINDIFRRCVLSGRIPSAHQNADVEVESEDDVEAAFADSSLDDVSAFDRVEQADILQTAERLAAQLRKSVANTRKEPKIGGQRLGAEAASTEAADTSKSAPSAENGEK